MSTENSALARRWFDEVWNQKRESAIDELLAPDALLHGIGDSPEIPLKGTQGFKEFWRRFITAFPDTRVEVEETVADGNSVAARCRVRGRHTGPGLGAPTNREVSFTGISYAHVRNGKLAEGWNSFDFLALYQQLGLLPPLEASK